MTCHPLCSARVILAKLRELALAHCDRCRGTATRHLVLPGGTLYLCDEHSKPGNDAYTDVPAAVWIRAAIALGEPA